MTNGEAKFAKDEPSSKEENESKTSTEETDNEQTESEKIATEILDGILDGVMLDVDSKISTSASVTSVNSIEETKSVSSSITR